MTTTIHPISETDRAVMDGMREAIGSMPDMALTPAARPAFDDMIRQAPAAEGIRYEPGDLGAVPGWWCLLDDAPPDCALLYLHGGGYILGSADAYRNTVGQFAAGAGIDAFALEYRLAPEHPFPAAVDDAIAAYDALVDRGYTRIAIAGDSAGGGLTLALLAIVSHRAVTPTAVAVVSPWTDMTVTGESMTTRAAADPILTRAIMTNAAALYLAGADPLNPAASPLVGSMSKLTPVMIHVGADEVLLDDSVRYADLMEAGGGNVELHVWEGLLHVFTANIAMLEAAREAMISIGEFFRTHLHTG